MYVPRILYRLRVDSLHLVGKLEEKCLGEGLSYDLRMYMHSQDTTEEKAIQT